MLFAILNGKIDQFGIFRLFRCGEDQGWIRGCILWLIFLDGFRYPSVTSGSPTSDSSSWFVQGRQDYIGYGTYLRNHLSDWISYSILLGIRMTACSPESATTTYRCQDGEIQLANVS